VARWLLGIVGPAVLASLCLADEPAKRARAGTASAVATPAEKIKVIKDFKVERLYSVPKGQKAPGSACAWTPRAG